MGESMATDLRRGAGTAGWCAEGAGEEENGEGFGDAGGMGLGMQEKGAKGSATDLGEGGRNKGFGGAGEGAMERRGSFGRRKNGGDGLGLGGKWQHFGVKEKTTELGEGWEVWAIGWVGRLGAKAEYSEDEHIFRVKGSKSSGFDRDGFKAVWGGGTKDWESWPKF